MFWYGYLWCLNIDRQLLAIDLLKSTKEESFKIFTRKGTVLMNIPLVFLSAKSNLFKIGVPITKSSKFDTLPI